MVRYAGSLRTLAVLFAIGIDWNGRRQVLGEGSGQLGESAGSWKDFLLRLRQRGLKSVEMVVSDDHVVLRKVIGEILPEADPIKMFRSFPAQRPGLSSSQEE